jgi:hypothetical protein
MERDKTLIYAPEDVLIFRKLVETLERSQLNTLSPGEGIVAAGLAFLGRPYAAHTLEQGGPERLIINLRELDCFTFVENVVVLKRLVSTGKSDFSAYAAILKRLRYRNGIIAGYASRLHYFSDWLFDAEEKGFVRNITPDIGGERLLKDISYMTQHPGSYPELKDKQSRLQIAEIEKRISSKPLYYLPGERLRSAEDQIQSGDLLALTTDIEGMDVSHVGIALRISRRVHLLHASRIAGKVLVSPETLYGYLMKKKGRTGVMVARSL